MKKSIQGMYPIKKWLDLKEALAYTCLSEKEFQIEIAPNVSIAAIGKRILYKVAQIDTVMESNTSIHINANRRMRGKKAIQEMYPTKKWIDLEEAAAYVNVSKSTFKLNIEEHITTSIVGKKKMYKVADIDRLIEENIIIKRK